MDQVRKREIVQRAPSRRYSEAFKRKVIREIDSGLMTKEGARRRYNILGHSAVHQWYRRYSNFATGTVTIHLVMGDKVRTETELKARIRDLTEALAHSELKNYALEKMIDLAETTYQIDVRKNSGAKQSMPSNTSDPQKG